MGLITRNQKYHCFNDCTHDGCPEHKMAVYYHSVTDGISVHFDGRDYYFDPTTLGLFIKLLKSMDRVAINSIFKE
jgi:hypothetical protein